MKRIIEQGPFLIAMRAKFLRMRTYFGSYRKMVKELKVFPEFEKLSHATMVRWEAALEAQAISLSTSSKIEKALKLLESLSDETASNNSAAQTEVSMLIQESEVILAQLESFILKIRNAAIRLKAVVKQ